jgi:hypothetical protein
VVVLVAHPVPAAEQPISDAAGQAKELPPGEVAAAAPGPADVAAVSMCAQGSRCTLVWRVSVNTVADSMRRQGLKGRKVKHNRGLTRQDRTAPKFPDLLRRDFSAAAANLKWVGDITEIPTDKGKLYLATVLDLCSGRLLAAPTSDNPNAAVLADEPILRSSPL